MQNVIERVLVTREEIEKSVKHISRIRKHRCWLLY